MKFFTHPLARYVMGDELGLGWLERLSLLDLRRAETLEWHRHEEVEVIYCLKGMMSYEFQGASTVTLPSGCCLVVPPLLSHRRTEGVDEPSRRLSVFIRAPRAARKGHRTLFSSTEFRRLHAAILQKALRPFAVSPGVLELVANLSGRIRAKADRSMFLEMRAWTFALVAALAAETAPSVITGETRLMDEAVRWLAEHHAEQVTLDQLVAYMGYGRARFCDLFKRHTGLPPMAWLMRYRLARAKELLTREDVSVAEAAHRVGFRDPALFSRAFQRQIGMSPRAWRQASVSRP